MVGLDERQGKEQYSQRLWCNNGFPWSCISGISNDAWAQYMLTGSRAKGSSLTGSAPISTGRMCVTGSCPLICP